MGKRIKTRMDDLGTDIAHRARMADAKKRAARIIARRRELTDTELQAIANEARGVVWRGLYG